MSTARTTSAHITPDESRQLKSRCLDDLREALPRYESRLKEISPLLWTYALDVVRTDIDIHNEMELLGFRKFLRILDTYPINIKKVQHVYSVFDYMTFDGLNGRKHYPMTPIQAYILAAIFGPMRSREQYIRLVTDAVLYVVRKFAKTTLAGFIAFYFLMYEDANAEVYCCANSANQSKILFKMAAGFVRQVDPLGKRIRQTATICEWRNGYDRSAKIESLTASAKAKDGAFAQLVCADEYGSAPYINEKSDMANLVQVMESSMGPRLEPLTLTTTTAGRISDGPFRNKLTVMEQTLHNEMNIELDGRPHTTDQDCAHLSARPLGARRGDASAAATRAQGQSASWSDGAGRILRARMEEDGARRGGDEGEPLQALQHLPERQEPRLADSRTDTAIAAQRAHRGLPWRRRMERVRGARLLNGR